MQNKIYKILVFGPQGSGKGTQAKFLAEKLGIPNISTGHLFRQNIQAQTETGKIADVYIKQGKLVPADVTIKMAVERLNQPDCQDGFVLDGIPRNRPQYDEFEKFIQTNYVVEIWVSDEESIERISGRRSCACGEVYHIKYNPPLHEGVCDKCGSPLFIREDDKPEQIKERLRIYHEETEPLLELYRAKSTYIKVNGEKSIAEVNAELVEKMGLD